MPASPEAANPEATTAPTITQAGGLSDDEATSTGASPDDADGDLSARSDLRPDSNDESLDAVIVSACEGPNCESAYTGSSPRYWGGRTYGDHTNLRNTGVGLLVAGVGMGAGAAMAGLVNMCGRDGARATDCSKDPRVHLAIGFGAAAVALTATGATLLGLANKRRKLDVAMSGHRRGGSVTLAGRF